MLIANKVQPAHKGKILHNGEGHLERGLHNTIGFNIYDTFKITGEE